MYIIILLCKEKYSISLAICVSCFLQAIPIVSKTRCLEKQGELQVLCKRGSLFSIRSKCTPVYMFLFNDLLILTTKKRLEAYGYCRGLEATWKPTMGHFYLIFKKLFKSSVTNKSFKKFIILTPVVHYDNLHKVYEF